MWGFGTLHTHNASDLILWQFGGPVQMVIAGQLEEA